MSEYLLKSLRLSIFFLLFSSTWAQTNSTDLGLHSIDLYLDGYISNNLDLQELKIEVEEARLDLDEVLIDNDLDITASTGGSSLTLDEGDVELEINPSLTFTVPKSQNSEVTVSVPMSIDSDTGTYFDGAGLSVSRDIISGTSDEYLLTVEYYERALFEAQLAVDTELISLKYDFWDALYDIYDADKTMKEDSDDLYDNQIDFDTIKAQGYSENSSTYRIAELTVKEETFTVEKDKRDLETLLGAFSVDCGFHPGEIKDLPKISDDYYKLELVKFEDYERGSYIDLEDAVQDFEYQSKIRSADSDFTLSAEAAYGYTGYTDSTENSTDDDEGNLISTELTATYGGFSTSLGISTLFEDPTEPSLTFSFSYDFGAKESDNIDARQDDIDRQIELLSIDSAKESWIDDKLDFDSTKATIEWTREQNAKQLNLYKEMYEDSIGWFNQGLIAETDLLQAKNSYDTKIDTSILTIIDSIKYNFGIEELFIGDK